LDESSVDDATTSVHTEAVAEPVVLPRPTEAADASASTVDQVQTVHAVEVAKVPDTVVPDAAHTTAGTPSEVSPNTTDSPQPKETREYPPEIEIQRFITPLSAEEAEKVSLGERLKREYFFTREDMLVTELTLVRKQYHNWTLSLERIKALIHREHERLATEAATSATPATNQTQAVAQVQYDVDASDESEDDEEAVEGSEKRVAAPEVADASVDASGQLSEAVSLEQTRLLEKLVETFSNDKWRQLSKILQQNQPGPEPKPTQTVPVSSRGLRKPSPDKIVSKTTPKITAKPAKPVPTAIRSLKGKKRATVVAPSATQPTKSASLVPSAKRRLSDTPATADLFSSANKLRLRILNNTVKLYKTPTHKLKPAAGRTKSAKTPQTFPSMTVLPSTAHQPATQSN
jgi:hypothetical protein